MIYSEFIPNLLNEYFFLELDVKDVSFLKVFYKPFFKNMSEKIYFFNKNW